nr:DUF6232 family protein [Ktedonobacteraceae bacterium]
MSEMPILTVGEVTVTKTRAVFGGKTYAMTNISSVTIAKKKINIVLVVIVGLIGLGCLGALASSPIAGLIGLIIVAGLIYLLVKPSYGVLITSAGGESQAYTSSNRVLIERIVSAVNEAIINRG